MAKQTWYRLDPAELLVEMIDSTPQEWYARTKAIAKALAKGEKGLDDWADRMIDDADDYIGQRRNAGRNGGSARATKAKRNASEPASETQADGERDASEPQAKAKRDASESQAPARALTDRPTEPTDIQTDRPIETIRVAVTTEGAQRREGRPSETAAQPAATTPTPAAPPAATVGLSGKKQTDYHRTVADRRKPEKSHFDWTAFSADPYAYLAAVPHQQLPDFAAWFCHEPDNAAAKRRYGAFCKAKGWLRFRGLLESFIGECKGGDEPDNRGAALTKRVMEAWT